MVGYRDGNTSITLESALYPYPIWMARVRVFYAGLERHRFGALLCHQGSTAKRPIKQPIRHIASVTSEGVSGRETARY